jgi:hypothetical protein
MSNLHSSYTKALPRPLAIAQYRSNESVQATAIKEYRRELVAPLAAAPFGSRRNSPRLVSLAKHVTAGENKAPETTAALLFGALERGVDIETVTRPLRLLDGMLRAQVPLPQLSLDDLQQVETEIEGICNNLQMRYMGGERTEKLLRDMLEKFERIHEVTGQIIAQLRKRLYGGPRKP